MPPIYKLHRCTKITRSLIYDTKCRLKNCWGFIAEDDMIFRYKDKIGDLVKDVDAVTKEYEELQQQNSHDERLSIKDTKTMLVFILQKNNEYTNTDLEKMFNSKSMSPIVNMFRYILMSYIRDLMLEMNETYDIRVCKKDITAREDEIMYYQRRVDDANSSLCKLEDITEREDEIMYCQRRVDDANYSLCELKEKLKILEGTD